MDAFDAIGAFIFVRDVPQRADVIFVPGNGHAEPAEHAAALYAKGYAPRILPSGRWAVNRGQFEGQKSGKTRYAGAFETEWAFMRAVLLESGVPESAILREDRATFTYQNAIASRRVLERLGEIPRRAILCTMPVHARRCLLYYAALFPETELLVCPPEGICPDRGNWRESPEGVDAVLQELERCGAQFHEVIRGWSADDPLASPDVRRHAPE